VVGNYIITPFLLKNGYVLLVNRGFVPNNSLFEKIEGDIELEGIVRKQEKGNLFTPKSQPLKRQFSIMDIDAMKSLILHKVVPVIIDASRSGPKGIPKAGATSYELPNNHLSYAITWFTLTAVLTVMTWKFIKK